MVGYEKRRLVIPHFADLDRRLDRWHSVRAIRDALLRPRGLFHCRLFQDSRLPVSTVHRAPNNQAPQGQADRRSDNDAPENLHATARDSNHPQVAGTDRFHP